MTDSCSILMIDDNPADGEMVRRYLNDVSISPQIEFERALSAEEALDALRHENYDVLLIDYHFPFGNGFDILRRLREGGIGTPAIMLTGQGSEEIAGRAVSESLSGYLPKPELSPDSLEELLKAALTQNPDGPKVNRDFIPDGTEDVAYGPRTLLSEVASVLGESGWSLLLVRFSGPKVEFNGIPELLLDELSQLISPESNENFRLGCVHSETVGTVIRTGEWAEFDESRKNALEKKLRSRLTSGDQYGEKIRDRKIYVYVHSLDHAGPDPAAPVNEGLDRLQSSHSITLRLSPED